MVDEETVRLMNPGALRIHTPLQSALSVTEKEITPMSFVANEAAEDENYETLKREILSVKCLDADGNEATLCSGNQPLTFEAVCNASVEEGATVTFKVYREGDDPAQVEPIETMSAIVRQGRARFELDLETAGSIAGKVLGGVIGGETGARIGGAIGRNIGRGLDTLTGGRVRARFYIRADSAECEEVQSECVEVGEEPMGNIDDIWDHHTRTRIGFLHPDIRDSVVAFILDAQSREIYLRITADGHYRSFEEQETLYAQGRTTSGNIVTNVRGGHSWHNFGLAIDVVEIRNRQAIWENERRATIGRIGRSNGFAWGGDWTGFTDRPHFEMTFGFSTAQLRERREQGLMDNGFVRLD
jgi:uncharacterized protein YcfJ